MISNWDELKKQIENEINDYFSNKTINVNECIDLIKKVVNAVVDDSYNLSGVAANIQNAFFTIYDDSTAKKDRLAHFAILRNVEPFLKKILYFTNKSQLDEIKDSKSGLAPLLRKLNLNPRNIIFSETSLTNYDFMDYEYHLIKTYLIRNLESHNMERWNSRELEVNITSITIFYIEAINHCKNSLKGKIITRSLDFSSYIEEELKSFEEQIKKFVAIDTIEDFSLFQGYAVEHKNTTDDEESTERSGTVDSIRKNKLPEKRMLLWGEAGLGKSTTFKYLSYMDAKSYSDGRTDIIPVYIPLGMLINKNESIENYIFNKIRIDPVSGKELLLNGKLNIFLDGVNEIPEESNLELVTIRIKEIQAFIDNYKNCQILISNRPEKYNKFRNVPVFRLQKMDTEKINEFLEKNSGNSTIKQKIKNHIENNPRLLKIISTPLMATRMVVLATDTDTLPESEGLIIRDFINHLFKREVYEKQDPRFDESKIDYLLSDLAFYGFNKNKTNSGLSKIEVIDCFAKCIERLHFTYDTSYALEILLKLGILDSDKNREIIVFSHQAYQDYYVSRTSIGNSINQIGEKKN